METRRWKPVEWAEEKGQIEKSVGPFIDARMRERQVYCHRERLRSISPAQPIFDAIEFIAAHCDG